MKNSLPLFIAWVVVTTVLLTLPGSALPKENWLALIRCDKWVHIGLFAVMAWLGARSFVKFPPFKKELFPRRLFWVAVSCAGYGILMEFIQHFWIPNRSFEVADIIADAVGSGAGSILYYRRYIKK